MTDRLALGALAAARLPGLRGADVQIGCVVPDIEAGCRLWTSLLGIGPWIAVDDYAGYEIHWGGRSEPVGMSVAFGYLGDLQIELIAPRPGFPSPHREFLESGGNGFHHFGFLVEDYAAAMEAANAAGLTSAFEVSVPGARNRAVYFESPAGIGPLVEIVDLPARRRQGFHAIRELAKGWDGENLLRRYHRLADFMAERTGA